MKTAATYLEMWERLSPIDCRLIARRPWRTPLRTNDIALKSGLTMQRVRWISASESWSDITIGDANKFRLGCGITPANESKHIEYLKRTQLNVNGALAHLNKLTAREKRRLLKLMD